MSDSVQNLSREYRKHHANGLLHLFGTRNEQGIFVGQWLQFHESGAIHVVLTRTSDQGEPLPLFTQQGRWIGNYKVFYKNGNPQEYGINNEEGIPIGKREIFFENGNLLSIVMRVDEDGAPLEVTNTSGAYIGPVGKVKNFYENGNPHTIGTINENGIYIGDYEIFYEDKSPKVIGVRDDDGGYLKYREFDASGIEVFPSEDFKKHFFSRRGSLTLKLG